MGQTIKDEVVLQFHQIRKSTQKSFSQCVFKTFVSNEFGIANVEMQTQQKNPGSVKK